MPYGTLDASDIPQLEKMLYTMNAYNKGMLTAGDIIPGVPTIHEIGYYEGARLRTRTEARHLGFGYFKADEWQFRGGGAMFRSTNFSWSDLYENSNSDFESLGYDMDAARQGIIDTIARLKCLT